MRRLLIGLAIGLAIGAPIALGAAGDQTVKGNLEVKGVTQLDNTLTVIGGTATTGNMSVGALLSSPRIAVTSGGFGFGFLNEQGSEVTRIVAGQFSDPSAFPAPPSSLLIRRDPAQLWFRTDSAWTCIAGCSP